MIADADGAKAAVSANAPITPSSPAFPGLATVPPAAAANSVSNDAKERGREEDQLKGQDELALPARADVGCALGAQPSGGHSQPLPMRSTCLCSSAAQSTWGIAA
ncbi:hypothetical protein GCM10027597_64850 [Saccharopolyspora tripterygii]